MFYKIRTVAIALAITFTSILLISQSTYAQPYSCLPTCDGGDAQFFVFAGPGQSSFIETRYLFGISSPDGSENVEIGIFDGDDGTSQGGNLSDWDEGPATLRVTIFADPMGVGATDMQLGQWLGDGSSGNNSGVPMPDNDWFDFMIPNDESARSENGNFRYTVVVDSFNNDINARNQYKLRTDGTLIILPFEEFAFMSRFFSFQDQMTVWPNVTPDDINDPTCFDGNTSEFQCNMLDPACCTFGGPYDGTFRFFIDVGEGQGVFNAWDGDFDFGSASGDSVICNLADGVNVDTDDFNTPPGIPEFATNTGAVPQGVSTPTNPPDDFGCTFNLLFNPSVIYDVITPLGDEIFTNENPSGSQEWELYNIGSVPDVDVPRAGDIPAGFWEFRVRGLDFGNLAGLRFDFPVVAVNENGEPVPFDPTPEPEIVRNVPTMNEWGMLVFVAFALLVSVYYLRIRRMEYDKK